MNLNQIGGEHFSAIAASFNKFEEMVRLRNTMGDVGIGVDVLVYSDSEASRRSQVPGTLLCWAFREGKVLYDART